VTGASVRGSTRRKQTGAAPRIIDHVHSHAAAAPRRTGRPRRRPGRRGLRRRRGDRRRGFPGVRAAAGLPPDRATAEVEFLYHLSAREASAWLEGDRNEAARLRAVRDRFIVLHAGAWLPVLADDLGLAARLEFFAGLATLLGPFIRAESAAITPGSDERT
jgi:hypothetical protein